MTGNGRDQTHLLVVCTAERGLCGALQQPDRPAWPATTCASCLPQGKTVKIICVGKKGFDILRRQFAVLIIDRRRPA